MSAEKNIYTHLHLRGNELRGFVFERLESDPDPIDGRIYYNVAKNEFRACISGVWVNIFSIWHVDDDGNITTDKQVIIKNNLIVEGDTSSGGEGEDTPSAGLDKTRLQEYLDEHKYVTEDDIAGLIPSNIATVDYVNTKFNSIDLSPYAKTTELNALTNRVVPIETWMDNVGQHITYDAELDAIVINHNLIVSGDTSSGGEGEDTPSGGGGIDESQLAEYLESNNYVNSSSKITSLLGYTPANEKDYLPLAGGTIESTSTSSPLIIKTASNGWLMFRNTAGYLGEFGFSFDKIARCTDTNGNARTLIHSGNIGSQSVSHATTTNRFKVLLEATSGDLNTALAAGGIARNYNGGLSQYTNAPSGASYGIVLELRGSTASSLAGQLAWDVNHASTSDVTRNLWWRASDSSNGFKYGKWHQIAFTDSNVASATKLATPRTIWGQSFDGTGNVSGGLYIGTSSIFMTYDSTNMTIYTPSGGKPIFGYGTAAKGYDTYIDGYKIRFRYGTSHTEGLMLSSSGNVLIGTTTDDASHKVQIDGTLKVYEPSQRRLYTRFSSAGVHCGVNTSVYTGGWNGGVTVGADNSSLGYVAGAYMAGSTISSYFYGGASFSTAAIIINPSTKAVTMSSTLSVNGPLTIAGKEASTAIMSFSRTSANYIIAPTGGTINFGVTGVTGVAVSRLRIDSTHVSKGTGVDVNLGQADNPWTTIYGVNGIFSGDTSNGSDIRYKDIIKHKTLKIEDIAKAPLFTFKWNDREDDVIHLGSSAQYWESVAPWIVTGEDFKTLNYGVGAMGGVISLARHDLQQDKKIKAQDKEIKALKRTVKVLKKEIKRLKEERYGA